MSDLFDNGGLAFVWQSLSDAGPVLVALAVALSAFAMLSRILGGSSAPGRKSEGPGFVSRAGTALTAAFTTNWQLTLLASTAFVLSLASGWTTWDGMRNFTGEPILSFMVTFGIQGVMLIIAWLIGESFASGLSQRSRGRDGRRSGFWGHVEPFVGMVVGGLCALGLLVALANSIGAFADYRAAATDPRSLSAFADKALYLGVGLLVLATLLINQRSDVVQPYLQSARVMARNAVLWVMFLSCMATSVFFSFDSLFSSIFPKDERRRAADIRAQRQVAGAVSDIGALAVKRQAQEAEALFRTKGWTEFEGNLAALSRASQGAEQEIERYFVERMEAHKSAMAAQQERIATARGGQAGLVSRKAVLTDELSRLKGERPALASDLAEKRTELDSRARGVDAKRVEMMAEEKGAEGTLKVGKGPIFRQRKGELDQLQDALKIQEQRVRDAEKRIAEIDLRIAQIGRELAGIDADLAKLKGEADTAEQRIAIAEQAKAGDGEAPKVDPARVRGAFERAHAEFRQGPTIDRLSALAAQCTHLLDAMTAAPATKDRVRAIDCDPKPAAEAAGRVFALNAGLVTFAQNCTGGDKLPISGGTDAMLGFGRKCLQDSGLSSTDSADMAARISAIDLNRDDKAHRFVVTWNAFQDGNRLAYLALAIAIAIDSLVFMSGVFGANAIRSPLTDLEGRNDLTADQLESAIDTTLQHAPDPRSTLAALLRAMHPIPPTDDGFTSEIILDGHDPHLDEMRQVLVAAATIGAVRRVGADRGRYLVSTGLARYFAMAQRKPWKVKSADVDRKELVNVIGVALLPDPQGNAELVLSEMHPISDAQGFAAETQPFRIEDETKRRIVINTLGAGATVPGAVKRNNDDGRYFVSIDFYKTLLLMRAAAIPAFRPDAVNQRYARLPQRQEEAHGGQLSVDPQGAIERPAPRPLIADQSRAGPASDKPGERDDRRGTSRARADERHSVSTTSVPVIGPSGTAPAVVQPAAPPPLPGAGPGAFPGAPRAQVRAEPVQPAQRKPQSSRIASEIRAEIIQQGLHPWSDIEIENAARQSDPALEDALSRLIRRDRALGPRIEDMLLELDQTIDNAYAELAEVHAGDPRYLEVLETEVQKLKQLLPILVMTPEGPYLQLVDREMRELRVRGGILEDQAGNGRLSEAEIVRLRRLGDHTYQLRSLSDTALDRLQQIAALLDTFRDNSSAGAWSNGAGDPPMT